MEIYEITLSMKDHIGDDIIYRYEGSKHEKILKLLKSSPFIKDFAEVGKLSDFVKYLIDLDDMMNDDIYFQGLEDAKKGEKDVT